MKVVCAPMGIVSAEFPKQGLCDLVAAGFQNVMLDFSIGETPVKHRTGVRPMPGMKAFLDAAGGVTMPVAHAPKIRLGQKFKGEENVPEALRARLEQMTLRAIDTAAAHGCQAIIVPPMTYGIERTEIASVNRAYYLRLAEAAEKVGMTILLTPAVRYLSGHFLRGFLSDGRAMREAVDALNASAGGGRFGCCLDMQAAGACGQDMFDFIRETGSRLQAVLLTDTDGNGRKQLLPYTLAEEGQYQTDWLGVIRGLRTTGFDGMLVLALRDTASACPPLLRPTLLQLAKKTADYLAWQIGMEREMAKYPQRVLFGAGRMCRNYLLNYGEKYPPLFTCDNNPATWGTEVDGLPVKSPEELRKLPEDCAIFICNVYYREIETQLRDMGLPNPVAYFNDECPPKVVLEKIGKKG